MSVWWKKKFLRFCGGREDDEIRPFTVGAKREGKERSERGVRGKCCLCIMKKARLAHAAARGRDNIVSFAPPVDITVSLKGDRDARCP